jgi:hypothetical protein
MIPLKYELIATPPCATSDGALTYQVNGSKASDLSIFGITVEQTLDSDNSTITVSVKSYYTALDLDKTKLELSIQYAVGVGSYTLAAISIVYTSGSFIPP